MAKQFVESNKYVFTSKIYLHWCRRNRNFKGTWHKTLNGRTVQIQNNFSGIIKSSHMSFKYSVYPEWCKCIQNNQGKL